jgi:UDP-N-acetylglucosamine 4-epimerase
LLAEINRALGTHVAPEHGMARPGDVRHSLADIARAQADLGYRPTTDVAQGVRAYVAWYRAQSSTAVRPLALSA